MPSRDWALEPLFGQRVNYIDGFTRKVRKSIWSPTTLRNRGDLCKEPSCETDFPQSVNFMTVRMAFKFYNVNLGWKIKKKGTKVLQTLFGEIKIDKGWVDVQKEHKSIQKRKGNYRRVTKEYSIYYTESITLIETVEGHKVLG